MPFFLFLDDSMDYLSGDCPLEVAECVAWMENRPGSVLETVGSHLSSTEGPDAALLQSWRKILREVVLDGTLSIVKRSYES